MGSKKSLIITIVAIIVGLGIVALINPKSRSKVLGLVEKKVVLPKDTDIEVKGVWKMQGTLQIVIDGSVTNTSKDDAPNVFVTPVVNEEPYFEPETFKNLRAGETRKFTMVIYKTVKGTINNVDFEPKVITDENKKVWEEERAEERRKSKEKMEELKELYDKAGIK